MNRCVGDCQLESIAIALVFQRFGSRRRMIFLARRGSGPGRGARFLRGSLMAGSGSCTTMFGAGDAVDLYQAQAANVQVTTATEKAMSSAIGAPRFRTSVVSVTCARDHKWSNCGALASFSSLSS